MMERNNDKVNADIALQARLNEKNKRSKGKWSTNNKVNFFDFWWKSVPKFKEFDLSKG